MKITPANLLSHELIGLNVKIVNSREPTLINLTGLVAYETKKTLHIYSNGETKVIPKDICRFAFYLPQGAVVEVDGQKLVARPEDRVKRLRFR